MARAKDRPNQRGVPRGPRRNDRVLKTAGRPTPRTGGGMKLATKKPPIRGPKPTDTGGRVVTPKKKPPIRGPKPQDLVTPRKKPPIRSIGGRTATVRRAGMMKRLADQRSSANQRRRASPMRRRARPMRRR